MRTSPRKAIAAGFLICMGCIVYLQLLPISKIAAAILFSAGLWFVLNTQAELFTGRVTAPDYSPVQKLLMLLYNVAGASLCGFTASLVFPDLKPTLPVLAPDTVLPLLWKSVMCGVCMYLATRYRGSVTTNSNAVVVLPNFRLPNVVYGVTLFILSGYTHSIAIAGYVAIARFPVLGILLIPVAALGNTIGSYAARFALDTNTNDHS